MNVFFLILRLAEELVCLDKRYDLFGHKFMTRLISMTIIWNKHFFEIKTWHRFDIQHQKPLVRNVSMKSS